MGFGGVLEEIEETLQGVVLPLTRIFTIPTTRGNAIVVKSISALCCGLAMCEFLLEFHPRQRNRDL